MKRILFIGNSHTYFNDMIGMFMCMANEIKSIPNVEVTMLAHPYVNLDYHKDQPEVRFNILYGGYDYIVIQQGAHPFKGEKDLIDGAKAINEFIKETNGVPVAYMTWAQKDKPENQDEMTRAYVNMSKKINAILAPVGEVFKALRDEDIELYYKDGSHASKIGSYISAATILKAIFKCDLNNLPTTVNHNGKNICILEKNMMSIIKKNIESVFSKYAGK